MKVNNREEAPTREQLPKILNTPMEVKKIWARRRVARYRN